MARREGGDVCSTLEWKKDVGTRRLDEMVPRTSPGIEAWKPPELVIQGAPAFRVDYE